MGNSGPRIRAGSSRIMPATIRTLLSQNAYQTDDTPKPGQPGQAPRPTGAPAACT